MMRNKPTGQKPRESGAFFLPPELADMRRQYLSALLDMSADEHYALDRRVAGQIFEELYKRPFLIYSIIRSVDDARKRSKLAADKFDIV
jgi:hypothetical protein